MRFFGQSILSTVTPEHNQPNGPIIGPTFPSYFKIVLSFVLFEFRHLPHVYTHGGFFWYFISIGNCLFFAVEVQKIMPHTFKKRHVFGWFCVSPQRRHFFSLYANLLTVLEATSQYFADICIPMNVPPLPRLDICHDPWTLARELPGSIFSTGLPAISYCSSMGKHLWAASLDTAHSLCKLAT